MPRLVKRYFYLLWQQRSMAVIGLLLASITAIAGVALLAVSGWFISATALAGLSIVGAQSFNYFAPGAIVRGLSITRTVGRYTERITTHEATLRVISRLRAELFGELANHSWQDTPLNHHDVSSRLLEDIKHAEALYLSALVPGFVMLLCSLLYLITLSLFLPSSAIWFVPIVLIAIFLMPWLYMQQVRKPQDHLHQQRNRQWNSASSLFSNVRTLMLYQRFEENIQQLLQAASSADNTEQHANRSKQRVMTACQLWLAIQIPLLLWQGLSALSDGRLEGSLLFMLLLLTLGTQEVILSGISALANFGLGYAALQRMDQHKTKASKHDQRTFVKKDTCAIKIAKIRYCYPQRKIATIDGFSAELRAPHWYWITAPSGHGKTTLLQLLMGHLQPEAGTISLEMLARESQLNTLTNSHTAQITLMPQKIDLLRGTLRYNLCLHQIHSDEALNAVLKLVELEEWFQGLPDGFNSWLGEGEHMLSGGELKRLGIARLMLQESQIVLLDEPTAGIDQPRAERILKRLHQYWAGKLIIINSHDMSLAKLSDQHLKL